MSRRTAEANKAIRLAWEREHYLVQQGKGTRDWTKEQQQDILDPDKGKAYDDKGRAFEGQHMKSVEEYPEYQGNPDNIQFLTKEEHFEAHKGSWQNPTNWYYDPVTKEFTDFGDGKIISYKIIELSAPIVVPKTIKSDSEKRDIEPAQKERRAEKNGNSGVLRKNEDVSHHTNIQSSLVGKASDPKSPVVSSEYKSSGGFIKALKAVGRFIVEHPIESIEIAGVVVGVAAKAVSSIKGTSNKGDNTNKSNPSTNCAIAIKSDIATTVADIVEKANRSLPRENDVPEHSQRYHTKDGVVWKDKAPYHRGGKKNS